MEKTIEQYSLSDQLLYWSTRMHNARFTAMTKTGKSKRYWLREAERMRKQRDRVKNWSFGLHHGGTTDRFVNVEA